MERVMFLTYNEAELFGLLGSNEEDVCGACVFDDRNDKMPNWCKEMPCDDGIFLSVDLAELTKRLKGPEGT